MYPCQPEQDEPCESAQPETASSAHVDAAGGAPGGAEGTGGWTGGGLDTTWGGGLGITQRLLQSVQSVPRAQELYSAPAPPSSQSPSDAYEHVSKQQSAGGGTANDAGGVTGGGGDGEGGGGAAVEGGGVALAVGGADGVHRLGQSVQSVPEGQDAYTASGPPSSQ